MKCKTSLVSIIHWIKQSTFQPMVVYFLLMPNNCKKWMGIIQNYWYYTRSTLVQACQILNCSFNYSMLSFSEILRNQYDIIQKTIKVLRYSILTSTLNMNTWFFLNFVSIPWINLASLFSIRRVEWNKIYTEGIFP